MSVSILCPFLYMPGNLPTYYSTVARHLSEKLSARVLIEGLFYALKLLGFDLGIGPLVVDYLYHLPNSRAMELEGTTLSCTRGPHLTMLASSSRQDRSPVICPSLLRPQRCRSVCIPLHITNNRSALLLNSALRMQTRLAKLESLNSPRVNLTFLQTHPSGQTRVKVTDFQ